MLNTDVVVVADGVCGDSDVAIAVDGVFDATTVGARLCAVGRDQGDDTACAPPLPEPEAIAAQLNDDDGVVGVVTFDVVVVVVVEDGGARPVERIDGAAYCC